MEIVNELPGSNTGNDFMELAVEMTQLRKEGIEGWGIVIDYSEEWAPSGLEDPEELKTSKARVNSRLTSQKESLKKNLFAIGENIGDYTLTARSGILYAQYTGEVSGPADQGREAQGGVEEGLDGEPHRDGGGSSERADAAAQSLTRLR